MDASLNNKPYNVNKLIAAIKRYDKLHDLTKDDLIKIITELEEQIRVLNK